MDAMQIRAYCQDKADEWARAFGQIDKPTDERLDEGRMEYWFRHVIETVQALQAAPPVEPPTRPTGGKGEFEKVATTRARATAT